jgi:hypothetical protein
MFVEHGEAKMKEGKDNGESLSTFYALSMGGKEMMKESAIFRGALWVHPSSVQEGLTAIPLCREQVFMILHNPFRRRRCGLVIMIPINHYGYLQPREMDRE